MEGARDAAVMIITEIDRISQGIIDWQIREVDLFSLGCEIVVDEEGRTEGSGSSVNWLRRLKDLQRKLDGMIPYLNVALAAANVPSPPSQTLRFQQEWLGLP